MFEADTDFQWSFHCLSLSAGLIVVSLVILLFGGFGLFMAVIAKKYDIWAIIAFIVIGLIILGALWGLVCAFAKKASWTHHDHMILSIIALALILTLIAQWIQWAILLADKSSDFDRSTGNFTVMAVWTVICLAAIWISHYGRSVAASLSARQEEGKSGWEGRSAAKKPETKKEVQKEEEEEEEEEEE